jgi:hypothetical protein
MDCRVKLVDGPEGISKKNTRYQHVDADSLKEAAEKLYGRPLQEQGADHQLRAIVRVQIAGKEHVKHFFDNSFRNSISGRSALRAGYAQSRISAIM